tara:strand:- start:123 stop:743 length:621 start_codon:yes stop_codon:yes gene_type:complete
MFSIGEAIAQGWRIFKENTGLLVGVHIAALLIQVVPQMLFTDSPGLFALTVIVSMLLSFVVALGLVRIGLNLVDGKPASFGDLFACSHLVFKYLIASLLHGFLILVGLMLLIAPGLIWGAQFSQWPFLMVEHDLGPIEALKQSSRITRGTRGKLILLFASIIGLVIAGLLALVVGILVAYPVITVASAFVYREILASQPRTDEVAA